MAIKNPQVRQWLARAAAAVDSQDYELALEVLTMAVNAVPEEPEPLVERGIVHSLLKNYPRAVVDFSEAIRLNPRHKEAYFNRGIVYGEMERHDREMADYNSAIAVDPSMAAALDARGDAHYQAREFSRAMNDYHQAIIAYSEKGKFDEAWKVVYKVKRLGWSVDRTVFRELTRSSGRRK